MFSPSILTLHTLVPTADLTNLMALMPKAAKILIVKATVAPLYGKTADVSARHFCLRFNSTSSLWAIYFRILYSILFSESCD